MLFIFWDVGDSFLMFIGQHDSDEAPMWNVIWHARKVPCNLQHCSDVLCLFYISACWYLSVGVNSLRGTWELSVYSATQETSLSGKRGVEHMSAWGHFLLPRQLHVLGAFICPTRWRLLKWAVVSCLDRHQPLRQKQQIPLRVFFRSTVSRCHSRLTNAHSKTYESQDIFVSAFFTDTVW